MLKSGYFSGSKTASGGTRRPLKTSSGVALSVGSSSSPGTAGSSFGTLNGGTSIRGGGNSKCGTLNLKGIGGAAAGVTVAAMAATTKKENNATFESLPVLPTAASYFKAGPAETPSITAK